MSDYGPDMGDDVDADISLSSADLNGSVSLSSAPARSPFPQQGTTTPRRRTSRPAFTPGSNPNMSNNQIPTNGGARNDSPNASVEVAHPWTVGGGLPSMTDLLAMGNADRDTKRAAEKSSNTSDRQPLQPQTSDQRPSAAAVYLDLSNQTRDLILSALVGPQSSSLRALVITNSQLTSIPQLPGSVEELDLSHNFITRIDRLAHLPHLRTLSLDWNQISVITGLSDNMKLEMLGLGHNRIKEVARLEHLGLLRVLDLTANQINSFLKIRTLSVNVNLAELYLEGNPVAEKSGYRHQVSNLLPNILVLDGENVKTIKGKAKQTHSNPDTAKQPKASKRKSGSKAKKIAAEAAAAAESIPLTKQRRPSSASKGRVSRAAADKAAPRGADHSTPAIDLLSAMDAVEKYSIRAHRVYISADRSVTAPNTPGIPVNRIILLSKERNVIPALISADNAINTLYQAARETRDKLPALSFEDFKEFLARLSSKIWNDRFVAEKTGVPLPIANAASLSEVVDALLTVYTATPQSKHSPAPSMTATALSESSVAPSVSTAPEKPWNAGRREKEQKLAESDESAARKKTANGRAARSKSTTPSGRVHVSSSTSKFASPQPKRATPSNSKRRTASASAGSRRRTADKPSSRGVEQDKGGSSIFDRLASTHTASSAQRRSRSRARDSTPFKNTFRSGTPVTYRRELFVKKTEAESSPTTKTEPVADSQAQGKSPSTTSKSSQSRPSQTPKSGKKSKRMIVPVGNTPVRKRSAQRAKEKEVKSDSLAAPAEYEHKPSLSDTSWMDEIDPSSREGIKTIVKNLNEKINKLYNWHLVEIDLVSKQQLQLNSLRLDVNTAKSTIASSGDPSPVNASARPSGLSPLAVRKAQQGFGLPTPLTSPTKPATPPTDPAVIASVLRKALLVLEREDPSNPDIPLMKSILNAADGSDSPRLPLSLVASGSRRLNDPQTHLRRDVPVCVVLWIEDQDAEIETARLSLENLIPMLDKPKYEEDLRDLRAVLDSVGFFAALQLPREVATALAQVPDDVMDCIRILAQRLQSIKETIMFVLSLSQSPANDTTAAELQQHIRSSELLKPYSIVEQCGPFAKDANQLVPLRGPVSAADRSGAVSPNTTATLDQPVDDDDDDILLGDSEQTQQTAKVDAHPVALGPDHHDDSNSLTETDLSLIKPMEDDDDVVVDAETEEPVPVQRVLLTSLPSFSGRAQNEPQADTPAAPPRVDEDEDGSDWSEDDEADHMHPPDRVQTAKQAMPPLNMKLLSSTPQNAAPIESPGASMPKECPDLGIHQQGDSPRTPVKSSLSTEQLHNVQMQTNPPRVLARVTTESDDDGVTIQRKTAPLPQLVTSASFRDPPHQSYGPLVSLDATLNSEGLFDLSSVDDSPRGTPHQLTEAMVVSEDMDLPDLGVGDELKPMVPMKSIADEHDVNLRANIRDDKHQDGQAAGRAIAKVPSVKEPVAVLGQRILKAAREKQRQRQETQTTEHIWKEARVPMKLIADEHDVNLRANVRNDEHQDGQTAGRVIAKVPSVKEPIAVLGQRILKAAREKQRQRQETQTAERILKEARARQAARSAASKNAETSAHPHENVDNVAAQRILSAARHKQEERAMVKAKSAQQATSKDPSAGDALSGSNAQRILETARQKQKEREDVRRRSSMKSATTSSTPDMSSPPSAPAPVAEAPLDHTPPQSAEKGSSESPSDPLYSIHLPDNWTEEFNQAQGRAFYTNSATGESSWEPPQGTTSEENPAAQLAVHSHRGRRRSFAVEVGAEEAEVWLEMETSTGEKYFYSPDLQETSWERPSGHVVVHSSPQKQPTVLPTTESTQVNQDSAQMASSPPQNNSVPTKSSHKQLVREPSEHLSALVLPDGWTEEVNHATGRVFYANSATGETSWDPPRGTQSRLDPTADVAVHSHHEAHHSSFAQQVGSQDKDVWLEFMTDDGQTCYYNADLQETVWDRPTGPHVEVRLGVGSHPMDAPPSRDVDTEANNLDTSADASVASPTPEKKKKRKKRRKKSQAVLPQPLLEPETQASPEAQPPSARSSEKKSAWESDLQPNSNAPNSAEKKKKKKNKRDRSSQLSETSESATSLAMPPASGLAESADEKPVTAAESTTPSSMSWSAVTPTKRANALPPLASVSQTPLTVQQQPAQADTSGPLRKSTSESFNDNDVDDILDSLLDL